MRGKLRRFRVLFVEKIWRGENPGEILAKRYRLFVFIGFLLIGLFAAYRYFIGIAFLPNFEIIIPVLVVTGSVSIYTGASRFGQVATKYFGVLAIISYLIVMTAISGVRPINVFVGTGFIFAWLLATRNNLSLMDEFKKLLLNTTLTAAIAILLYDFWTGIVGCSLLWGSGWVVSIGQIPFTFYHLCSLIFVPPLVELGKLLVKVKVPVAVATRAGVKQHQRR